MDMGKMSSPKDLPANPKQFYGDLKVGMQYIPTTSWVYEALGMMDGAEKYGPYNWRENGVEAMTYVGAALRHIAAWVDGEELAPDSGKPHLGHAKACLGILADALESGNLIDNRPPKGPSPRLLECWKKQEEK